MFSIVAKYLRLGVFYGKALEVFIMYFVFASSAPLLAGLHAVSLFCLSDRTFRINWPMSVKS